MWARIMLEFFGKAPTRRQAGVNFAGMRRGTRLPVMKGRGK